MLDQMMTDMKLSDMKWQTKMDIIRLLLLFN